MFGNTSLIMGSDRIVRERLGSSGLADFVRLEFPLVRHRGSEDGKLAPEQIPGVELEHRSCRRARDHDPTSFPEGPYRVLEGCRAHVVDDHIDAPPSRQLPDGL